MGKSGGVDRHYGRDGLQARVLDALIAAGVDLRRPRPEDLAPLEEFHTLGRSATLELAELAGISQGERVIDIGAGLGGPARLLARQFGCRVCAVDLTPEYCELNALLTESCGLKGQVEVRQGNALELPFGDASFDVVWTQHVSMNISDKRGLYTEAHRVLAPGGRLAFFDVVKGEHEPIHFPVPWADDPSISFLSTPDELEALVKDIGFRILAWNDLTERAADWYRQRATQTGGTAGGIGLQLLAEDMPVKLVNQARNVDEGRARLLQAVLAKTHPGGRSEGTTTALS